MAYINLSSTSDSGLLYDDFLEIKKALQTGEVSINPENKAYWDNINSAGRLWGGEITDNGDGTVAISAGEGLIKDTDVNADVVPTSINDGQGGVLSKVSWDAISSLTLTDNAYNYIFYNGGTDSIDTTTDYYSVSLTNDFLIGRVYKSGTEITARICGQNLYNFNRLVQFFGEERFPVERANGLLIGETGTRNISITSGTVWAELVNRFTIEAFDSSGTDTFTYWWRDGSGGFNSSTGETQIDNTQYDDGSGTLATLTSNRYGVHWVYVVHDSSVHVVYGRGNYNLEDAENANPPSDIPGLLKHYSTLVGKVIIQEGDSTFYDLLSPFETQFIPSIVADHINLSNLQGGTSGEYYHLTSTEYSELSIGETVAYETGHTAWADGLSSEEIHRIELQTGESFVVERIEFRQKGGGSSTSASIDVYDETSATVIGSANLGSTTKNPGTTGTGNSIIVRLNNSTGGSINASVRVIGYISGA